MIKSVIDTIDIKPILNSFLELDKDVVWTNYTQGKQTGLQYRVNEDYWSSAIGKSQGKELEYTELNPFFKDTIFETIINQYSSFIYIIVGIVNDNKTCPFL